MKVNYEKVNPLPQEQSENSLSFDESSMKDHVETIRNSSSFLSKDYKTGDPAISWEDIAQEAAIKHFHYRDKYDPEKSKVSYFQKIAIRAYHTQNKKRERKLAGEVMDESMILPRRNSDPDSDLGSTSEPAINEIAAPDEHLGENRDFEVFLSTLPPRQYLYCKMKEEANSAGIKITDAEIAEKQGVTRQTVDSDKKKAEKAFRKFFGL